MSEAIENFWETVDQVFGVYLDASAGFHLFRERFLDLQKRTSELTGLPLEHLDTLPFTFGRGDPGSPDAIFQHEVTQEKLKHRNRGNGENGLFLGALCVVSIYQFWEDKFRKEIAAELGIKREELKDDLLGDLRLIRIAIVHHGSIAKKDIEKCKLLKWFKEGDPIIIDEDRMNEIINKLRTLCESWISKS